MYLREFPEAVWQGDVFSGFFDFPSLPFAKLKVVRSRSLDARIKRRALLRWRGQHGRAELEPRDGSREQTHARHTSNHACATKNLMIQNVMAATVAEAGMVKTQAQTMR